MKLEMMSTNDVATHWHSVYFQNGFWRFGEDKKGIYYNLVAPGDNPHHDDVDAVIGNKTWTSRNCTGCGTSGRTHILIGEIDYDTQSAYICKPCCQTALKMFEGEEK